MPLLHRVTILRYLSYAGLVVLSSAFLSMTAIADQVPGKKAAESSRSLIEAIESAHRSAEQKTRDIYRHPLETLRFFEVEPSMTVVEIWPGAGGWYTDILAPYLYQQGKLYVAQFNADSTVEYFRNGRQKFAEKLASKPEIYDRIAITTFEPPLLVDIAPPGTADRVLTFRNVHNWYMQGGGDEKMKAAFKAFHRALKPGGMLGVVEHRLPASRPLTDQEESGYMNQAYVIKMAENAGFKLVASSEINANPKDTADHPSGVWTLPPSLRLGDKDKARYQAIGESDRMTLKFIKLR